VSAPLMTCSMCGHVYDPAGADACAACPLHTGCAMTCCPACGYTAVDPHRSGLARWFAGILGGRAASGRSDAQRAHADGPLPDLMLAELSPGEEASVVAFEGPAADRRAQLQAYGLVPGRRLRVVQQRPVTVLLVDHTELAIEGDLARGVKVQRPAPDRVSEGIRPGLRAHP
jgi:Fe2+ transport system protein FeoA